MLGSFWDSRTASFVFNESKSSVHVHSAHWNKMDTCDFGPVTAIRGGPFDTWGGAMVFPSGSNIFFRLPA